WPRGKAAIGTRSLAIDGIDTDAGMKWSLRCVHRDRIKPPLRKPFPRREPDFPLQLAPVTFVYERADTDVVGSVREGRFQNPVAIGAPRRFARVARRRQQSSPRRQRSGELIPNRWQALALGNNRAPRIRHWRAASSNIVSPAAVARKARQPLALVKTNEGIDCAAEPCGVQRCSAVPPRDLSRVCQVRLATVRAKLLREISHYLVVFHEAWRRK